MLERKAQVHRKTSETDIKAAINLNGTGKYSIKTGIGFFDHMLSQLSKHAFIDLDIAVKGDIDVDCHHSIEDTGIVLGQVFAKALGDKKGIKRYGSVILPMEEALVLCALDLSGRPYLVFDAQFTVEKVGDMDTEMVEEFFRALCIHGGINLHIKVLSGRNNHHIIEAIFKAFAKALNEAIQTDPRIEGVLSTKGVLEA
jgi:imidazoleglycerol-phosphate dehydratase